MSKKKYPEQRSATAEPQPGQTPAKPTGNEIFDTQASSQGAQAPAYSIGRHDYETQERERASAPQAAPRRAETTLPAWAEWIRQNPIPSVLAAAGIGLFIGWMRRR